MMRCFALLVALTIAQVAAAAEPKVAERWAVLIGVDDYAYAQKLQFCGADQRAFSKQLIASGFPAEHVFLLEDKTEDSRLRPSKSNIDRHLNLVLGLADAEDLVVIAFSGHGVRLDGKSFLCPSDCNLDDSTTLIGVDSVYDRLANCGANFKLVVVDACRNDPRPGGARAMVATEGTRALARSLHELKLPEGVVLLNSCAPGEVSWEDEQFGHGVFMHYLLDGLQGAADTTGDARVSLNELQSYAGSRTKTYVANRHRVPQRPFFKGDLSIEALEYALLPVVRGTAVTPLKPAKPERPKVEVPASVLSGGDPIVEAWTITRTVVEPQKRSKLLRTIAAYQTKLSDLDTAKEALAEAAATSSTIADVIPRRNELLDIAAEQIELSDLTGAKKTLLEVAAAGRRKTGLDRESDLRNVAVALYKAGDPFQARRVFDEVYDYARGDGLYLAFLAESQAQAGDTASSIQTFDEAKAIARKSTNAGWELCTIAVYQIKAGMEAAARATYAEARRFGELRDGWKDFFIKLAVHQVRQGQLKEAEETVRSIGDLPWHYSQSTFGQIIEAHAKQGELAAAIALAKQLTNEDWRNTSISTIASAMLDRGDISGAFSIIGEITSEDWRQSCVLQIGRFQLKQGDARAALATARSLSMSGRRFVLLASIASTQAEQDAVAAESLFNEAVTGLISLSENDRIWATSNIAGEFSKAGQLKRAYELAYAAPTPEGKAEALIVIANALHEKKQPPKKDTTP